MKIAFEINVKELKYYANAAGFDGSEFNNV